MSSVSVVIVHHESDPEIFDCLSALRDVAAEVIVVDNNSSDDAAGRISSLGLAKVVSSSVNLGFAGGANLGARNASATDYLMFLNPDATVESGAVTRLATYLDSDSSVAVVGPRVLSPDGSIQPSKRRFPSLWDSLLHGLVGVFEPNNPGTRRYLMQDLPTDKPSYVDWVSGSALMVRRNLFDELNGFDEGYFFFVEDVDLCKRMADRGHRIAWEPRAVVHHTWGRSWSDRPLRFAWLHRRALVRYTRKFSSKFVFPFVWLALLARFVLVAARRLILGSTLPAHSGSTVETKQGRK